MTRVALTGAAGFLGRHAVAAAQAAGWQVNALVHTHALPTNLLSQTSRLVRGCVEDVAALRELLGDADCVLHLAAYVPPDHHDASYAEQCFTINALSTLRLAQLVGQLPGRRLIYASAGNAYVRSRGVAHESSPVYPAIRATYYLASKLLGELYIEYLRHSQGLPAVSLRISSPYGPGMPDRAVVSRFMHAALTGKPLQVHDGGRPRYDLVSATDVASVTTAALDSGAPGLYNVAAGKSYSLRQIAAAVARTFSDRRLWIEVLPASGLPPASFPTLSVAKARATWNYQPHSLGQGLAAFRRALEGPFGEADDPPAPTSSTPVGGRRNTNRR